MTQLEFLYDQLQALSAKTLVLIIDELKLEMPNNEYRAMSIDIYNKAKAGKSISDKQRRVLVNIIGQPTN